MSNLPQFTLEELAKYNGETDPKIYISMGGNGTFCFIIIQSSYMIK